MKIVDADILYKEYMDKFKEISSNRNVIILREMMKDLIEQIPEADAIPSVEIVGEIKEYPNGTVAMRKETYDEYNKIVVDSLPKKFIESEMSAVEFLESLRIMQNELSKEEFMKILSNDVSDADKVEAVKNWKRLYDRT